MVGIFNSIGHETEDMSRDASAELMQALSTLYLALEGLEKRNLTQTEDNRNDTAASLRRAEDQFRRTAAAAGDYLVREPPLDDVRRGELERALARLERYGYREPLRNSDLSGIAASEVAALAEVIESRSFTGDSRDWFAIRDILDRVMRVQDIGLITSRISALIGHG